MTEKRLISVYIDREVYDTLKQMAQQDNRSISKLVSLWLAEKIKACTKEKSDSSVTDLTRSEVQPQAEKPTEEPKPETAEELKSIPETEKLKPRRKKGK